MKPGGKAQPSRRNPVRFGARYTALTLAALAAWFFYSQDFSAASLGLGAAFALLTAGFCYTLFFAPGSYPRASRFFRLDLLLLYFVVVLVESYIASFKLVRALITRRYQPGIVRIRTRLRSKLGRVLLANTISMVPGTLSLWLEQDRIYVHWFDVQSTHTLRAGRLIKERLERILLKVFG